MIIGAGIKKMASGAFYKLWDNFIELQSYSLKAKFMKTILLGQTADILSFVKCQWYEFVNWFYSGA